MTQGSTEIIEIHPTIEDLIKSLDSKDFSCELCGKTFQNHGARRMHKVKTHLLAEDDKDLCLKHRTLGQKTRKQGETPKEMRFLCPTEGCSKFFKERKLLNQHFRKVHEEKKLECEFCMAKFGLERDLKYHKSKTCPIVKGLQLNEDQITSTSKENGGTSPKKNKIKKPEKVLVEKEVQTEVSNDQQNGKWVLVPVVFTPISTQRTVIVQTGEEATIVANQGNSIEQPPVWNTSNEHAQNIAENVQIDYQQNTNFVAGEPSTSSNYGQSIPSYGYSTVESSHQAIQTQFYDSSAYHPPNHAQLLRHNETQTIPTYEIDTSQEYWPAEDANTMAVASQTEQSTWTRQQDFGTQFSWDDFATEPVPIDQNYVMQGTQTMPLEEADQIEWFTPNFQTIRETQDFGSMTDDLYEMHQLGHQQ